MSGQEADQDHASRATVGAIHTMAHGYDGVAVCCDSRKSWRKELAPTYKANRPPSEEPMLHQLRLAKEQLAKDGFPVWEAEGFEADDVIASAVARLAQADMPGAEVVIASSDKDLFQLVGDFDGYTVRVKSIRSGEIYDVAGVEKKFGVRPEQIRDWLCLVGDSSDNVKGIKDIGPKRATELLKKHGSLANIYANLGPAAHCLGLTPSMYTNLKEGLANAELARKLVTLRTDVELPFADILKPRAPQNHEKEFEEEDDTMAEVIDNDTGEVTHVPDAEPKPEPKKSEPPAAETVTDDTMAPATGTPSTAIVAAPAEWTRGLEPTSYHMAIGMAKTLHNSRLFSAYGTPQAVLAVIMAGREFGFGVMQSLRSFHIVEGKPTMSAGMMSALVLGSGKAKQFRCIHTSTERATFRCQRSDEDTFIDVSFTIEEARAAGLVKPRSGWEKYPADMLVARARARAGRLVWPDVLANVYTFEEMGREDLERAA
jgi:5'-3' exonuclease